MRRGYFILMDFLVSVAIIAILGAILFPVFTRARDKAVQASCINNLLNVGTSLRQYAADHDGQFPPNDLDLTPLLGQWLPEPRSLICPGVGGQFTGGSGDYSYRGGYHDDDHGDLMLMTDRVVDRHNRGANCLYIDGRARWNLAHGSLARAAEQLEAMPGVVLPSWDDATGPPDGRL